MSDENHGLSEPELQMAKSFGMSAEDYAAHRSARGAADWNAAEAQRKADAEHERLKAAVREALDERDGEAA